jgi:RNA polymerase sigma-70 factor (ECF subfamily)
MDKVNKKILEAELVRRVKSGDSTAVEDFVSQYSSRVYSLAYQLTRSSSAAEEIMQEVFITVISKIGTLENEDYFSTWLYRVTTNAAYGFLRKEKKHRDLVQVDDVEAGTAALHDFSDLPDDILLSDESRDIIRQAIDKLPETLRTIIIMKDVEGLKNEEIAEAMKLSLPAVKSRVHRGRLMLRDKLSRHLRRYS